MSGKLVVEIWHCPYGDASTILVLMALADEANDKGEYEADMSTIARKARQSERNCRYLLRRLESLEIVECLEQRGRGHKNSYRICTENLQNLQKGQPLPVLRLASSTVSVDIKPAKPATIAGLGSSDAKPAKPAKPATIAGLEPPFPSDSPSQDLQTQDLNTPPISPQSTDTSEVQQAKPAKEKRAKRFMPKEETAQRALAASIFDAKFEAWRVAHYPHADAEAQWTYFVNYCLASAKPYADFRAAFMNSFPWENSPAQHPERFTTETKTVRNAPSNRPYLG